MNIKLKVLIASVYILCLGILMYLVFNYLEIDQLNDYSYIKDKSQTLIEYKKNYLLIFIILFFFFCIIWIFLMGFATPLGLVCGFVFGNWLGTLISVIGITIGATLFYIFVGLYFREIIIKHLEHRILKFKNLFKKNEFLYYMIFRLSGGAGIPFVFQNTLPVLFDMKSKNYFYASLLGLVPSLFILNSLGSGIEKLIQSNTNLNFMNIISEPGIYWPILGFIFILISSYFIKKYLFKS